MKRIPREDALVYGPDASLRPALEVRAGEPFAVETEDASLGHLTAGDRPPTLGNTPYVSHVPAEANPVGGPVLVDGIRAGGRVKGGDLRDQPRALGRHVQPPARRSPTPPTGPRSSSTAGARLTSPSGSTATSIFVVHQMTAIGDLRFVVGAALPRRSAEGRA